ncbi:MAG: AraC family transcriptional regulator [Bacteroidia bacterium]|nr:AraC family transcriptional regulator [Bacteroidia bacterium]
MLSVAFDTGVALIIDEGLNNFLEKSYFEVEKSTHFLRLEFHLTPQDSLFSLSNYTVLFITYTDPIWTQFNHNPLYSKFNAIQGVRYYLPCEMHSSISGIIGVNPNDTLCEMKYTSIALETLISAIQFVEKLTSNCNSCNLVQQSSLNANYLQGAMQIIQSRYTEKLTIPELAKEIGTNQCYLKKGFKLKFGDTIFGTITKMRMIKANELIRTDSNKKLSEIAEEVGYSSLSSFSTAFKQYWGYSPQELKR